MTRGRGDAPITWGDESDAANTKFKEVVLPSGMLDEQSQETVAVTPAAPEVAPAETAPRNARRLIDPASGKETWNRKLRPRHRKVVRKYFGTEQHKPVSE